MAIVRSRFRARRRTRARFRSARSGRFVKTSKSKARPVRKGRRSMRSMGWKRYTSHAFVAKHKAHAGSRRKTTHHVGQVIQARVMPGGILTPARTAGAVAVEQASRHTSPISPHHRLRGQEDENFQSPISVRSSASASTRSLSSRAISFIAETASEIANDPRVREVFFDHGVEAGVAAVTTLMAAPITTAIVSRLSPTRTRSGIVYGT